MSVTTGTECLHSQERKKISMREIQIIGDGQIFSLKKKINLKTLVVPSQMEVELVCYHRRISI